MTTWPDRCRAIREAHGWTQAELAQHLNCSASAVAKWESGANETPLVVYQVMLQALERQAR